MTRIQIEVKKEIITKHENGVRLSDLATHFDMSKSMIRTLLKTKEMIKGSDITGGLLFVLNKDHR